MLEYKDLVKRIKEFSDNHRDDHSINVADFKISKNLAGGNGFNIASYDKIWGKDRAQVCASGAIMEPIVNSVCFKFNESPFDFIASPDGGQEQRLRMSLPELKFQLGSCLRDAVQDGISYMLVFKKGEEIKFKKLSNFNVILGDCDYSNGEDASEAVYIGKRDTGKKQRKTDMSIAFESVLNLNATEIPVVTYWYKENGKICTAKIEGDEVKEHREQKIESIPIARIYGKEIPGRNFKKSWRGIYYLVKDILRTMDFEQSLIQERIATAPNHLYWIAEESLSNPEQLAKVNDFPVAYKTYRATNPVNPQASLPPPEKNDLSTNISDLTESFERHKELVYQTLGSIAGDTPGNETAEAVLMRRESKDSSVNEMLKNLLDSAHRVAGIIGEFTGIKVTVASDIFDKAKQNDELQKIIALTQFMEQSPHAYAVTPVLLSKLNIDDNSKQAMLKLLEQEKQSAEQRKGEAEAMQMQMQQLQASQEAQVASAQINAQSAIARANIDAQTKDKELEFKWAELKLKADEAKIKLYAEADRNAVKLDLEAEKISNQAAKDVAKLELDAVSIAAADTTHNVI